MSDLFRKEAVENHSSGRDATLAVKAIPVKWLFYIIVVLLCSAAFAIWLFFGTVYESVVLRGVVWPPKNFGDCYSEVSGILSKTTVSVGDYVEAGDILAIIPNNEILAGGAGAEMNYEEYDRKSVIRSNISGYVTYIKDRNSYVNQGDRIATVMQYDIDSNNDVVTAFVPDVNSRLITIGTEVHVMPDDSNSEEDGYVLGYVSAVSNYPMTGERIYNSYNHLYMSDMSMDESYTEVQITMMRSADTVLKWSKPSNKHHSVSFGTRCDVELILNKYKPYRWLLRWVQ